MSELVVNATEQLISEARRPTELVIQVFDQWSHPVDAMPRLCGTGWSRSDLAPEWLA
jgi:hypothetical protein